MAFNPSSGNRSRMTLSEINVTPMVDVMLVLLIIFVVAAPMMTSTVEVRLPKTETRAVASDEDKLLLTITEDKRVLLGKDEVAIEALAETLASNRRVQVEQELYIRADERVPYGVAARVFALAQKAGVQKVGLVTQPYQGEPRDDQAAGR